MRNRRPGNRRRWPLRLWLKAGVAAGIAGALWINGYVEREIKPTMMQIAEYEARRITTQAIHKAVQSQLEEAPQLTASLYQVEDGYAVLDAATANRLRSALIGAIEEQMAALPEQEFSVPVGSLTDNYLLSGQGPGWSMQLQPEGYVQAAWQERAESLSLNTTRCTAALTLSVTVNMILDGDSETLTVQEQLPVATLLLQGDVPAVYAAALD